MSLLVCWKCGADLAWVTMPLRRLESCKTCQAELHVCRFCSFYDTQMAKSCREPIAEDIKDKEHANFCGYLVPNPSAYKPLDTAAAQSQNELSALFGEDKNEDHTDAETAARNALDDLFGEK